MKAFCFSESASARLSEKDPLAENDPAEAAFSLPPHLHFGSGPQIPSGPEYGDCEEPSVPRKRSLQSNCTLPNCAELKLTCTSFGYWKTTSKCEEQLSPGNSRPLRP